MKRKPSKKIDKFVVSLGDREIAVNDYIISRPFTRSSNRSFFEAIYFRPEVQIYIDDVQKEMMEQIKNDPKKESLMKIIKWGKISKILNALGFRGEILKAFFPIRTNSKPRVIKFLKTVSKEDLKNRRININLLIQELKDAHRRNSPV